MFVATDLLPPALLAERREMRISEVSGVLEARRVLEPGVAQLAAVHATDADFAALERTLQLQRDHAHDWERLLQLDTRFHLDMARATHNPTLVGLVKPLLRQLEVARDMALRGPHVAAWTIDIHRRTIDAPPPRRPDGDRRGHGRAPRDGRGRVGGGDRRRLAPRHPRGPAALYVLSIPWGGGRRGRRSCRSDGRHGRRSYWWSVQARPPGAARPRRSGHSAASDAVLATTLPARGRGGGDGAAEWCERRSRAHRTVESLV